jgi:hypothetical protein
MQLKSLFGRLLPICLIAFTSLPAFSQSAHLGLFNRDKEQEKKWNALRSNQKVAVIQYDADNYEKLRHDDIKSLQLDLPGPDHDMKLNLEKNDIFAEGFYVSTDKEKSVPYAKGVHYKGKIEGQPESVVAISFFDNEVIAVINESNGNKFVVGQSNAFRRGSFVVYNADQAVAPAIDCMSESLPGYADYVNKIKMPSALEQRAAGGCVNIYFELGLSVYSNKQGTTGATNYITGAFNIVSTLYANDGVNAKISQVFVWTTAEPYAADASTALTQFGQAKALNFNGTLAQLVRLKTGGSMSGIAWVNVLCYPIVSSSGAGPYSYAEVLPTYNSLPTFSWTAEVITHELGHNLGSPHTHSCSWSGGPIDNCYTQEGSCSPGPTPTNGGTIMSYCHLTSIGINFNNGFGPQPKALILSKISNATCVVACSTGSTCNAPVSLAATNVTTIGATLSWAAVSGAVSYTVNYKLSTATTWTTLSSAVTTTSVAIGSLNSSTAYDWQVRTNCSAGNSVFAQSQFTTLATGTNNCTTNPPAGLTTTNIAATTATMSWSASSGASSYNFYIKASTDANFTLLLSNTTSLSVNVTGLTSGVTYQWRVNANCAAGSSGFTQAQFTTLTSTNCTSFPPTGLAVSAITVSGATLSWTAVSTATTYAVQYKLRTATTWTTAIANSTPTSFVLSGLTAGTVYDWQVRSNCTAGSSVFTASSFTTASASTCNAPASLTTTNITTTTSTVSWAAVSGAFNYTLDIKEINAVNWIALTVTSSTVVNISGLTPGTTYQWRVKTNCTTGSSTYSQAQFTSSGTSVQPCNAPTSLTSTGITSTSATLNWASVGGATSYAVEYKSNASATWIIAAGATTATTFTLINLNSATLYDWRIKTNCSASVSGYTAAQFTTTSVSSNACPGSLDLSANESTATAKAVSFNTDVKGQVNPSGDVDYFSFTVTVGGSLTVSLTTLPADYDLRVINSTGSTMGLSQNGGTTSESLNLNLSAGTYYVRIYGWNGANSGTSCYTLRVQTSTASIEYNGNTFYNADALITSIYPNPAGNTLNYRIQGLVGPAELSITDLQGRKIMQSLTKDANSQLNVSSLAPGFYFLRVQDEEKKTNVVKFLKTL